MSLPLALALVLAPAQPAPGVRWSAPAVCPDAAAVRLRIESLLQRPLEDQLLALDGEIHAEPSGFRIELAVVVDGVVDRRSLIAADCETLTDTAALVSAVLLDPVVTAETTEVAAIVPEPPGLDARPPAATRPRKSRGRADKPRTADVIPVEPPRVRTPRDRELGVWTRISSGVQYGAVPGVTGGFELALALGNRRVRGEITGSYWIGRGAPEPDDDAIRVHLGAITPRVCATAAQRRIDVIACSGVEFGVMHVDVAGAVQRPLWIAVVAEAGIRAPLTARLSLWVSAVAFIPARFPELQLEDPNDADRTEQVYRPTPAGVRGLLGLEIRLRGLEKRK